MFEFLRKLVIQDTRSLYELFDIMHCVIHSGLRLHILKDDIGCGMGGSREALAREASGAGRHPDSGAPPSETDYRAGGIGGHTGRRVLSCMQLPLPSPALWQCNSMRSRACFLATENVRLERTDSFPSMRNSSRHDLSCGLMPAFS